MSTSVLAFAGGSKDGRDVEEQALAAPQQRSSSTSSLPISARSLLRATRPTVAECLGVPENEQADLCLDVYNMFFLSDMGSQGFFYSVGVFVVKFALYVLLILDLGFNKRFPSQQTVQASVVVKIAQLFLIPVAIVMQEELITSFFIVGHLRYSPSITNRHPEAYKWKYIVAHTARFVDGATFLLINISVMLLEVNDVLQLFLNFAALMFLQTIDNIALQVCLEGYWTKPLQDAAKDVVHMKLALRHDSLHSRMQSLFIFGVWIVLVALWANVHYN